MHTAHFLWYFWVGMLKIYLFNSFRPFYDDVLLPIPLLPKTLPLWAYLLLHQDTAVKRDTVAFSLWPDVAESKARGNLRRHLHRLQQALPTRADGQPWIIRKRKTIQWNMKDTWTDVSSFTHLITQERYQEAIDLYSGDLLPDMDEEWVMPIRHELQQTYLQVLMRLMSQAYENKYIAEAIQYAEQILATDPFREDIVQLLMRFHYESGDRASGLQKFETFAAFLDAELGVEPMPETAELHQSLLDNTLETKTAVSPQPAPFKQKSLPNNLPFPLTPLLGRQGELTTISQRLCQPETRLFTLTGLGGVGKTRLAVAVGQQLVTDASACFPDGVYWVSLAEETEAENVLPPGCTHVGHPHSLRQNAVSSFGRPFQRKKSSPHLR